MASKMPAKPSRRETTPIRASFEPVVATRVAGREVPTLVLRGEWLKAAGFPVGTHAYVVCDDPGELALHRLGLRFPRKMIVRKTKS